MRKQNEWLRGMGIQMYLPSSPGLKSYNILKVLRISEGDLPNRIKYREGRKGKERRKGRNQEEGRKEERGNEFNRCII